MLFAPFSVPLKCVTSSSSSESCAVLYAVVLVDDVCTAITGFDGALSPARTKGIGLKAGLDGGIGAL